MVTSPKDAFKGYLQGARDVLVWKMDGLTERQVRRPLTTTGTNLLGLVKHAINTEVIYFGTVFGRLWPTPDELVQPDDPDDLAGFYARADESRTQIVDLYRRVQAFADETIASLPLDAVGHVPHWGNAEITLLEALIHKTSDLQRHAGHADILREQLDGQVGLLPNASNQPDGIDWQAHTARLTVIADAFGS